MKLNCECVKVDEKAPGEEIAIMIYYFAICIFGTALLFLATYSIFVKNTEQTRGKKLDEERINETRRLRIRKKKINRPTGDRMYL